MNLPPEIVLTVVDYLPFADGLSLSAACRRLRAIIPVRYASHLHFCLSGEDDETDQGPDTRVVHLRQIKRFYELVLTQKKALEAVVRLTFAVGDSLYKIPLLKAPTSPNQVSRYPVNFLASVLITDVIPRECVNVRNVGVYVKEFKTCPKFMYTALKQIKCTDINVFYSGEPLLIPSRWKLPATHLTLLVDDYATIPPFVNKLTVTKLTLDFSPQKTVDISKLQTTIRMLPNLHTLRLKANILLEDILHQLSASIKTLELDIRRIQSPLQPQYDSIHSLIVTDDSDMRLHAHRFPQLRYLSGPFDSDTLRWIKQLTCDAALLLDHLSATRESLPNLRFLMLVSQLYLGPELTLVASQCPNLQTLLVVAPNTQLAILQSTLLTSPSLNCIIALIPQLVHCVYQYTGKYLSVHCSKLAFESHVGMADDSKYTMHFRPLWQPREKTKRRSSLLGLI